MVNNCSRIFIYFKLISHQPNIFQCYLLCFWFSTSFAPIFPVSCYSIFFTKLQLNIHTDVIFQKYTPNQPIPQSTDAERSTTVSFVLVDVHFRMRVTTFPMHYAKTYSMDMIVKLPRKVSSRILRFEFTQFQYLQRPPLYVCFGRCKIGIYRCS